MYFWMSAVMLVVPFVIAVFAKGIVKTVLLLLFFVLLFIFAKPTAIYWVVFVAYGFLAGIVMWVVGNVVNLFLKYVLILLSSHFLSCIMSMNILNQQSRFTQESLDNSASRATALSLPVSESIKFLGRLANSGVCECHARL